MGRDRQATLFTTLVAAAQAYLARLTGGEDITVGTVTSGRDRAEVQHLVGFFVNTLVLRSRVAPDRPFPEFLGDVRETVLDAFAHQEAPFEQVVDEVQPVRDTSRTPLFQVMVVLQNAPAGALDLPGLEVADVDTELRHAAFDLTLEFAETGTGELHGVLTYNTDLFDAATAERMADQLGTLLTAVAENPDRPLGALPWPPTRRSRPCSTRAAPPPARSRRPPCPSCSNDRPPAPPTPSRWPTPTAGN